ncbi:uncharacterized protein LOC141630457 [Silene latifolia]|uniref:uncharacterized protein LOC141630457 n=1 Tax=Silene latifolia TaxID=37657 RepID=UPI003D77C4E6
MIEVQIGQPLPDKVKFLDENGNLIVIELEFEWNPLINFIDYYAQCINIRVTERSSNRRFCLSMVYAFNDLNDRHSLWELLINFAAHIHEPWVVCEDFNCVLSNTERLGGDSGPVWCNLLDSPAMGSFFTWINKQDISTRVYSRLDMVLINAEWSVEMNYMCANFLPEGIFDHTPCLIQSSSKQECCRKPFKYYNMWGKSSVFLANLMEWWNDDVQGTKMCRIVRKLKHLKHHLKRFNKDQFDDIENCSEKQAHGEVKELQQACALFLSQKAKLAWSRDGDTNSKFFHGEIKDAVFSISDHKALGPDGFSSSFFKDSWSVIGKDVCEAIVDVFRTEKFLKQLNSTTITLIPKCKMPTSVTHFRRIACCNVLCKCVSKLICNRLAKVLSDLISKNEGGFIRGRSKIENIMVYQDLVRLYNKQSCYPRCMFKMDLKKAYDSVSWKFMGEILEAFNLPVQFKHLVMKCITSAAFSLAVNGETFVFFMARGV